jgi:chemotaxis protein methyltransferase CheR
MELRQISRQLQQIFGLDITRYNESFWIKTLEKRMKDSFCDSFEDYASYLGKKPGEVELFLNSLHVHFSEFFRDPLTYALLERVILPELVQKKKEKKQKEIRIWSAGCAAGQEPYSIAILLEEAVSNTEFSLNYRIFATDIDETILTEARLGRYPAEALKNVSLKRAQTWFTSQGAYYVIRPAIQQHINFSVLDLLDEGGSCPPASLFGDFDLVFCCNLLIYYQPEVQNLILHKFSHCIAHHGYLVTGETERAIALAHNDGEIYPQSAIFRMNQNKGYPR